MCVCDSDTSVTEAATFNSSTGVISSLLSKTSSVYFYLCQDQFLDPDSDNSIWASLLG